MESRKPMGSSELQPAAQLLHPQYILPNELSNKMQRWQGTEWQKPARHLIRADLRDIFAGLVLRTRTMSDTLTISSIAWH